MSLNARRAVAAMLGAGAVTGATLLAGVPSASAQPAPPAPPNCSAADLAGVAASVSTATSAYLFTHPPVNDFFTSLHDVPRDQVQARIDEYFVANPQAGAELKAIRKPLQDIRIRCGDTDGDGVVDIL